MIIVVCFLNKALSNDLINLSIIAFIKKALKSEASICGYVFCLITKKSITEHKREICTEFGDIASCAKVWTHI